MQDNKLAYIHDAFKIRDEDLEEAKKIDKFNEICEFYVNDSDFLKNTPQREKADFVGTFIDALKYIQKCF